MNINDGKFYSMTTPERIEYNNQLYDFLYPVMNQIHSSNFSKRFWMILLAPYVTAINSRRNAYISGELKIKPENEPINSFERPTLKEKVIINLKYYAKAYKTRKLRRNNELLLKNNHEVAYGFHDPASVMEDIPCFIPTYYPFSFPSASKKKRSIATQLASERNSIFEKNVIRQLPKYLIEFFDFYYNRIKLFDPALKTFNISMIETIHLRFLLSKYLENGAKLNYYQHGAFYGEYQHYSPYAWEYEIADKYFTWGWKMQEKNVPWKAYRLNRFSRNYAKQPKTKEFDCLIVFPQISKQNLESFRISTGNLIKQLDGEKYQQILVRPRPSATDLKYDEQFSFIDDPRVTVDSGKSVIGSLIAKSRLVVQYSYPSTNFLECLYVDHPSVVILKNNQPTEIVKPFYDFFLNQGVFHYDMESVTNHLNRIDIEEWWDEIIHNPLYVAYKRSFLNKEGI